MADDHDYSRYPDDIGLKDFAFGATGLGLAAVLSILFAIIF